MSEIDVKSFDLSIYSQEGGGVVLLSKADDGSRARWVFAKRDASALDNALLDVLAVSFPDIATRISPAARATDPQHPINRFYEDVPGLAPRDLQDFDADDYRTDIAVSVRAGTIAIDAWTPDRTDQHTMRLLPEVAAILIRRLPKLLASLEG